MMSLLNIVVVIYVIFNYVNVVILFLLDFYKEGDIYKCFVYLGEGVEVFEVLLGIGWDNLENRDGGMFVFYNYSKCLIIDDGKYIILDSVFIVFLKISYLEIFGEIFDYWIEYIFFMVFFINLNVDL